MKENTISEEDARPKAEYVESTREHAISQEDAVSKEDARPKAESAELTAEDTVSHVEDAGLNIKTSKPEGARVRGWWKNETSKEDGIPMDKDATSNEVEMPKCQDTTSNEDEIPKVEATELETVAAPPATSRSLNWWIEGPLLFQERNSKWRIQSKDEDAIYKGEDAIPNEDELPKDEDTESKTVAVKLGSARSLQWWIEGPLLFLGCNSKWHIQNIIG